MLKTIGVKKVPASEVDTRPPEQINRERAEAFWNDHTSSIPATQEWIDSGVSLETIHRNVETLNGQDALEFILAADLEKYSSQFVTVPLRRTLDTYQPIENGGWAVQGLDPLNNWERMEWGQLKPTTPRINEKGKPIKYEAPKGVSTRAIFLDSPSINWPAIQADPSIAIAITEGGKKSGCLQDQANIPAIALPGITSGIKKGVGLIPEIEALCQPGRLFVLAFDAEPNSKPQTQQAIHREAEKLRKEMSKRGCFLVIATWSPEDGKGIDDVWANHGTEKVKAIISDATERHQKALEATKAHKQEWAEQQEIAALNRWLKGRQFSPTFTINQQFVEVSDRPLLAQAEILAIKSGMGTGKTEWLCRTLSGLDSGAVMIGSRNSLLLQTAERLGGFYHLHSDSAFALTADPYSKIATCIDSLIHFADSHFDNKIIILDECASTLYHALQSNTLKGRRTECLSKLEQAVQRASVVIALDGNNNDITINHLIALRGGDCQVIKILNEYQGNPKDIHIANPINPKTGEKMVRSHTPVFQALNTSVELYHLNPDTNKAIPIISDSQKLCESLDRTLSNSGLNGIRIDSTTLETQEVQAFLKNPNQWILENQPDYVILSPTAESGIDISIKKQLEQLALEIKDYFGQGFAFFCGVLGTDSQTQFLNRFRDVSEWLVSCPLYTTLETNEGSRSPHAKEIEKHLIEFAEIEMKLALEGGNDIELEQAQLELERKIKAVANDQNTRTWAQLQAQRNYERQNTRNCLKIALEQQGHNVTIVDIEHEKSDLCDRLKEERDAIIERDSQAIFNAPDMTLSEAIKIKSKFGASVEDRQAAEKAILLARLPGIQDSDQWSAELVKKLLFTERSLLPSLERYWAIQNIDTAKAEAREQWKAIAGNDSLFLPDVRSDFSRAFALKSLGLDRLFSGEWLTGNSAIVQQIYKKIKRSKHLQTVLGLTVGKQTPIQLIGKLVKMIGGSWESQQATTGDRKRSYNYSPPEADPVANALLTSIQQRHKKKRFSESAKYLTPQPMGDEHLAPYGDPIHGGGVHLQSSIQSAIASTSEYSQREQVLDLVVTAITPSPKQSSGEDHPSPRPRSILEIANCITTLGSSAPCP